MANPVPGVVPEAPASRKYAGGFMCELMLKDLKIAAESAREVDLQLEFVEKTVAVYEDLVRKGNGKRDFGCAFEERRGRFNK